MAKASSGLAVRGSVIEINSNEPPILDGSAKIFAETLLQCRVKEFDVLREYYVLKKPMHFEAGKTRISAYPSGHLEIKCIIGFDHSFLRFQQMSLKDLNEDFYLNDIAPAKTFCFDYEIEALKKKGLALGGSMYTEYRMKGCCVTTTNL